MIVAMELPMTSSICGHYKCILYLTICRDFLLRTTIELDEFRTTVIK
jgi:hypothetical protein